MASLDAYCALSTVGSCVVLGELSSSQLCPYASVSAMVVVTLLFVTVYAK